MEKAQKKLAREAKKEAILQKRMEQDAMIEMKAKITAEAQKNATWDEDKLEKLMEKTIEKYVEKRKKEKAPSTRTQLVQPQQVVTQQQIQQQQPIYVQQTQPLHRHNSTPNFNNRVNYDDNPFGRFMS